MGKNEFLYLDSGVKGMSLLSEEWTKILLSGLNGVLANFKQVVSEHLASYKLKDFAWEQTSLALLVILDTWAKQSIQQSKIQSAINVQI